jgi:hypothetical protein
MIATRFLLLRLAPDGGSSALHGGAAAERDQAPAGYAASVPIERDRDGET